VYQLLTQDKANSFISMLNYNGFIYGPYISTNLSPYFRLATTNTMYEKKMHRVRT